jgi:hypothetical protein
LFRHTFGKTLRGNDVHIFAVRACSDSTVCWLKISSYTCISQKTCMGVNLRGSHLFRTSNRHGQITQNAFQGSAVGNKLKRHLAALQLSDGKTMHGSRSGCSITLSLIGASDDDVAQHVGWKSLTTAQYYTQTRQVIHTSKNSYPPQRRRHTCYIDPSISRLSCRFALPQQKQFGQFLADIY